MKKRYLNLVLAALVALFSFAACSSGSDDDSLLSWPSGTFKDIGLRGLAPPSGAGITANGVAERTVSNVEYSVEYVQWDGSNLDVYDGLNIAIAAKIAAGVAGGEITGYSAPTITVPAVGNTTNPYKTEYSYVYGSKTIYVEVYFTQKAYPTTVTFTHDGSPLTVNNVRFRPEAHTVLLCIYE
jgi:hypothetical protein